MFGPKTIKRSYGTYRRWGGKKRTYKQKTRANKSRKNKKNIGNNRIPLLSITMKPVAKYFLALPHPVWVAVFKRSWWHIFQQNTQIICICVFFVGVFGFINKGF